MTLGEMRDLLAAERIRLTRSLGQNFLHDGNQLRRIVALADVRPGDRVLEIGPGLGPLTEMLLVAGATVVAVEKDARLVSLLRRRLEGRQGLDLVHADALAWLRECPRDWSDSKLVANLPYSIGSALLVELAQAPAPPASMTVTLQAEVVDRIRAHPGTSEYGVLTLLLALRFSAGPSARIPSSCFFPAPTVTSACVRLDRRPQLLVEDSVAATYRLMVKTAFSQRRKRLRKVLGASWPATTLDDAWTALALDPNARPENLSAAQFAQLATRLA